MSRILVLFIFVPLLLVGCETTSPKGMHVHPKVGLNTLSKLFERKAVDDDLVGASHRAADGLIEKAKSKLDTDQAFVAASFVNIDDLSQSSSFGRIISQQLASQFSSRGYKLVEMLLRKDIYIKQKEGEFLLSRQLMDVALEHNVQAAIVGTYAVGATSVYVTAKVIDPSNRVVLASHDYELPLGPNTKHLLMGEN